MAAPRVNGVSTSIAVFRRELAALGVEVPLVAPRYADEPEEPGILRLRGFRVPLDPEDRYVPAHRFLAAARRLECDLVHVQTPFAAHAAGRRLARERGVPLVETWHTDFEHYFEHYLPLLPTPVARALAKAFARRVARGVDRLIVPSLEIDEALAALGIETPRSVVPTGLARGELGAGDGARFRARHGIPADRPTVVHVGRLAGEKNLEFLLRATELARRRIPELLLIVAGEGPAKADLQRLAGALGLGASVLWLGYLDRARDLADVYCAGDLFAFCSLTETQGLVLLEAMSLGVPVVALAERGTRDLLAAERGALVPEPSEAAFADALVHLLGDPALRARLSGEGRALAAAWSAGRFAERLAAVYAGLV